MRPLISLRNAQYSYSGRVIFAGIDLDIFPGESVVVTGSSGEGKSTLVRLAAGLLKPLSGHVSINAIRTGFVFQEPRLLPWRNTLENVLLPLEGAEDHHRKEALQLLSDMGLDGAEKLYPAQLSGGMRQRVALARALIIKPDLLMLDEPFTGLDHELRESMKRLLELAVCGRKIGILQITHHPEDTLSGVTRIFKLEGGKLTRQPS